MVGGNHIPSAASKLHRRLPVDPTALARCGQNFRLRVTVLA